MRRTPQNNEARARTAIARLELISHGTTSTLDPSGRSAEVVVFPGGGIAPIDAADSHEAFWVRLAECRGDADFAAVADDAEHALRGWQHSSSRAIPAWADVSRRNDFIRENPLEMTQRQMADHWGVSQPAISKIQRKKSGERVPRAA